MGFLDVVVGFIGGWVREGKGSGMRGGNDYRCLTIPPPWNCGCDDSYWQHER